MLYHRQNLFHEAQVCIRWLPAHVHLSKLGFACHALLNFVAGFEAPRFWALGAWRHVFVKFELIQSPHHVIDILLMAPWSQCCMQVTLHASSKILMIFKSELLNKHCIFAKNISDKRSLIWPRLESVHLRESCLTSECKGVINRHHWMLASTNLQTRKQLKTDMLDQFIQYIRIQLQWLWMALILWSGCLWQHYRGGCHSLNCCLRFAWLWVELFVM